MTMTDRELAYWLRGDTEEARAWRMTAPTKEWARALLRYHQGKPWRKAESRKLIRMLPAEAKQDEQQ